MTGLEALAARVERAKGPDRELDRDIALAVYPRAGPVFGCPMRVTVWDGNGWTTKPILPFTGLLDAAMTLVPEGLAWTLGQNVHHRHWQASINALNDDGAPYSVGQGGTGDARITPALALTAAALRARAHLTAGATHDR